MVHVEVKEGKRSDLETPGADAKGIRGPNADDIKAEEGAPGKVHKVCSRDGICLMQDGWSFDHGRHGTRPASAGYGHRPLEAI